MLSLCEELGISGLKEPIVSAVGRLPDGTEYARLRLQPGAEPRSRKQYRIPGALRPQLQKTIEELARHGLIDDEELACSMHVDCPGRSFMPSRSP